MDLNFSETYSSYTLVHAVVKKSDKLWLTGYLSLVD